MSTKTEPIYAQIGRRISVIRELRAVTQEEVGNACSPKLARAGIANMETGKQRIMVHHLLSIAQFLNVPVTFLLSGAERRGKGKRLPSPDPSPEHGDVNE